jgi:hypothetical protein
MDEKTTTRRVTAGDYDVTTHVQYSLVEGEHMVRLNPDAERLPTPPCPDLTAARARELARNLNAGADDADRRNGIVPERCDVHGGRSLAACDHPAVPAAVAEAVRQFLDEQLGRDDMTLAEIAAEAVAIATGASTFEPPRISLAHLEAGCPVCGTEAWGFTNSRDEDEARGPARCDNGHEWTVVPER